MLRRTIPVMAVALIGCSSESGPTIYPAVTTVAIGAPPHLRSNLEPTQLVLLSVGREDRETSVIAAADPKLRKEVESQFSLRTVSGAATVPGSFKWDAVEPVVRFHPSTPLAAGEYVAELKAGSTYEVYAGGTKARFRVGSLPRVAGVLTAAEKGLTTLVHVRFTEPMEIPTIKLSLSQASTAVTPAKLEYSVGGNVEATFAGIPSDKPLRIRVEPQARAKTGVPLDGDYSGKTTGTGTAFQIDMVPSQSNSWAPSL